MLEQLFLLHGRFCADHPLEVIVATFFTLTACMLNIETGNSPVLTDGLPVSATGHCKHARCGSEVSY